MRALRRDRYGGPEVLRVESVPEPVPGHREILIAVHSVSLNRSDWENLTGRPAHVRLSVPGLRRPNHRGLGSDVSGVVTAVGEGVTRYSVGQAVFGDLLSASAACLAEFMAASEDAPLTTRPDDLGDRDASTLPQAASLALQGLTEVRSVGPADRVLVVGAGGGAGSFAIQIARHLGATVDGVDNTTKQELMRSLGADRTFDHTRDDFTACDVRYDRIIDFVGRRSLRATRRVLADHGVYFLVGGSVPRILETLTVGSFVSRTSNQTMKVLAARPSADALDTLARWTLSGTIRPVVEAEYDLDHAAQALGRLGAGTVRGKLVVAV